MKTGIFGYKGRVRYCCAAPVNTWIDELKDLPRNEFFPALSQRIDRELHRNYQLYPCNYIALDMLMEQGNKSPLSHWNMLMEQGNHNSQFSTLNSQFYTSDDVERFEKYLAGQLAKINIPNKDEAFLRERMLTMYANPLRNYIAVQR